MKAIVNSFKRTKALSIITLLLFATVIYGVQEAVFSEETDVSAQTSEPLFSKNFFNVELFYAYAQSGSGTAIAIVNFTKAPDATLSNYSGVTEVYTVHVFSEGKLVSRNPKIGGIIGSGIAWGFDFMNLGMDGSFSARGNVGLETFTIDYSPAVYPVLKEPVSVSLIRLGWITTQGNNSEIHLSSQDQETVKQVELAKYKEGFLYNNLLNQETLPTVDLLHPLTSSPKPTPNQPNSSITPTPTVPELSWLVILPLFLSILSFVVLFRKRRFGDSYD
jgi:hypothetical protein